MAILPVGIGPQEGGYQIERSLRFNSADTPYLGRTFTTPTNNKKFTWSGWVKRTGFLATAFDFAFLTSASNAGAMGISGTGAFGASLNGKFFINIGSYAYVNVEFRDPSAWYHFVCVVDTDNATANDRQILYVNGVRQPNFSATYSSGASPLLNTARAHFIGGYAGGGATPAAGYYANGYLSEVNFIDGQALDPTSFGEYNTDTGVWQPKAYTGSYGTNGFYLDFADNSSTTALGYDAAGSNDWTPNNFSVTAGAGNDSLVDTPTPYGTDTGVGGEVRGNYATLNPLWKGSGAVLTNGNLDNTPTTDVSAALSTIPVSSGKFYAEISHTVSNTGALGMFFTANNLTAPSFGVGTTTQTGLWEWYDNGAGVYATSDGGAFSGSFMSTTFRTAGTFQFALDADNGKFWFGKNNVWYDSSGGTTGNPATGANPTFTISTTRGPFNFGIGQNTGYVTMSFNAGQRPFAYAAPSGFKALCTQNLPEPTVKDGSTAMNVVTYTGNATNRSIDVGMAPDFTWIKHRSSAENHNLYDILRGAGYRLESNSTDSQTYYADRLTAFTSTGFDLGTGYNNTNGTTYVAWNWKAGGTGVSNTDGSITSTVSANTTAGFSIVTYTGTGANATVGHGLGVAPKMVIVKQRNGSTYSWTVYNASLTSGYVLALESTSAQFSRPTSFNSTAPTSTVFSLGTDLGTNSSSGTYVAYCFAPVEGYSAFGSYTGNGSADGPFVYTGFRPRYVMIKKSSAASTTYGWQLYDTSRSPYNTTALPGLWADTSAAEAANTYGIDILSNGFKIKDSNTNMNDSGQTMIYAAFAENPFKYSLAR